MSLGNPTQLTRDMVAAVEAKYGCSLPATCPEEVRSCFVWGGAASAVQQSSAGAADGRLVSEQPCCRC